MTRHVHIRLDVISVILGIMSNISEECGEERPKSGVQQTDEVRVSSRLIGMK